MASLSIRDLDDGVRERLRVRAAQHGRSMEAEVRAILTDAVAGEERLVGLAQALVERFSAVGGVELELPQRVQAPRAADLARLTDRLVDRVVVLDTNVLSELMRPSPDAGVLGWVSSIPPGTVHTTAISVAELRFGIARLNDGRRRAALASAADAVFGAFVERVLAFDAAAAGHYADVVVERQGHGAPIQGFDAQIAAICRSRRAVLATRNTRDFAHLGLDVIDPWVPEV